MGRSLSYADTATQYARDVVAGDIVAGELTRLACQRHLDDLERNWEYTFDADRAARACRFIELLPHIEGPLAVAGELIRLEPWQVFIISSLFGWVNSSTRLRRYRSAYIAVARKNGKSILASGIALYMLCADGEVGAQVYSCATTREQARIVWKAGRTMVSRTPGLRRKFGVKNYAHHIEIPSNNSIFRPLSRDTGGNLDGLNISCAIIDELHAHKTRELYDVIDTATGARSQPLILMITTAGFDPSSICYERQVYTQQVLRGDSWDPSWFGLIYTVDKEDLEDQERLLTDETLWAKANPNLDVSVSRDDMRRKAVQALAVKSSRPNYLTKHLNVWVEGGSSWLDIVAWDATEDPDLDIADYEGLPCWIAADLASKLDVACVAYVFERIDGDGHAVFVRHYVSEREADRSRNSQYAGWAADDHLIVTPGDVTDYGQIEADLRQAAVDYDVVCVAVDPWQAEHMRQRLDAEGLPTLELRQSVQSLSEPMKSLEAAIVSGKIVHERDPVLRWMLGNVVCHVNAKDEIYPRKDRPEQKIDGAVALIMAYGRALSDDLGVLDGSEVLDIFADEEKKHEKNS